MRFNVPEWEKVGRAVISEEGSVRFIVDGKGEVTKPSSWILYISSLSKVVHITIEDETYLIFSFQIQRMLQNPSLKCAIWQKTKYLFTITGVYEDEIEDLSRSWYSVSPVGQVICFQSGLHQGEWDLIESWNEFSKTYRVSQKKGEAGDRYIVWDITKNEPVYDP